MKWISVRFEDQKCYIELENGTTLIGKLNYKATFYYFPSIDNWFNHVTCCETLFGPLSSRDHSALSTILQMNVRRGCFPETDNPKKFLEKYFILIGGNDEM